MPQDHPWTEAPFGYPGQNLEILDTTANEDINVQNILIGMHDSVLQIKNSLQDSIQKLKNIQKIMQGINISFAGMNEKFSKLESQNSAPKVEIQHQKQEKDPGSNISHEEEPIPQGYMPNPQAQTLFPQVYVPLPQGRKKNTRNTPEE